MKFTVIYTTSTQWGALVHCTHVELDEGEKLYSNLEDKGVDPCSIVYVFPGWHETVESDWSKIKG